MQRFALHILTSLVKLSFAKFLMTLFSIKNSLVRVYKENLLQLILISCNLSNEFFANLLLI